MKSSREGRSCKLTRGPRGGVQVQNFPDYDDIICEQRLTQLLWKVMILSDNKHWLQDMSRKAWNCLYFMFQQIFLFNFKPKPWVIVMGWVDWLTGSHTQSQACNRLTEGWFWPGHCLPREHKAEPHLDLPSCYAEMVVRSFRASWL